MFRYDDIMKKLRAGGDEARTVSKADKNFVKKIDEIMTKSRRRKSDDNDDMPEDEPMMDGGMVMPKKKKKAKAKKMMGGGKVYARGSRKANYNG
tara:strand:+ start:475 stop:756 length:282 start_codon:yes stop_codon:yes gene_type:complete